jgi:hypothetical protein
MVLLYGTSPFFLITALQGLCWGGTTKFQVPPFISLSKTILSENIPKTIGLHIPDILFRRNRGTNHYLQTDISSAGNDYLSLRS